MSESQGFSVLEELQRLYAQQLQGMMNNYAYGLACRGQAPGPFFGIGMANASQVHNTDVLIALGEVRQENARLRSEIAFMHKTFAEQHQRISDLAHALQKAEAHSSALLDKPLRPIIALCHPDKWLKNPLVHEVTVRLVALRESLRK